MLPAHSSDRPTPAQQPPNSSKATARPRSGKALAQPQFNDRLSSALLSLREQQVLTHRNQDLSFESIANHLGLSPAAARAYHRRALSKRQRTIALAPLEQGDSSAPRVRKAPANPEPTSAEPPRDRLASNRSQRSPFHSPAVDALAFRERPNAIDLCIPSLFVEGESVTDLSSGYIDVRTCQINLLKIPESLQSLERLPDQSKALEGDESAKGWDFVGRKLSFAPRVRTQSTHSPQTTITDLPRHPFCRKRTSRRSRHAGVGFRVALAS